MRAVLVASLLLSCFAVRVAGGEVAILPCIRDNTLFEDAEGDTSNGAGPAFFAGRNSQDRTRRAVLAFDLDGALPPDTRVDSVVLALHVSSAPDTTSRVFTLHRALRSWGEGTSSSSGGAGAPATPGDATWLHSFYPAGFWSQPGGDFDPAPSALGICGDIGPVAWSGPGLLADVRAWLEHPAENQGWVLLGEETAPRTVRRFDSRESSQFADRPTLTIHYSRLDPVASIHQSWGRLKASYR